MKVSYLAMVAMIMTTVLLGTSCSNKYDDAITEYIESASDLKIEKITETNELKKVTVGDSITYLNQKTERGIKVQIDECQKQMATYQEDLVKANTGKPAKILVEAYTAQIAKTQQVIDSLKGIKPESTKLYDAKKTDEILAIIVECKYTVNNLDGAKEDVIKNFVLSPDAKLCYGVTDNPTMGMDK